MEYGEKIYFSHGSAENLKLTTAEDLKIFRAVVTANKKIGGMILEKIVGDLLREKNFTIACAESCTGGLLTSRLTDAAGSSDYVQGSLVSYSNEIKNSLLRVKAETLKNFGAVSEETAREMATNVREIFRTNIGVGVTGIAGPGGGSKEKPVGTVFISVCGENNLEVRKFNFDGSRSEIKNQTVQAALEMIREFLSSVRG